MTPQEFNNRFTTLSVYFAKTYCYHKWTDDEEANFMFKAAELGFTLVPYYDRQPFMKYTAPLSSILQENQDRIRLGIKVPPVFLVIPSDQIKK